MRNKKVIIATLCIAVCIMAIGFAAFSTQLTIDGTANISSTWKVVFSNIEEVSKTSGVKINNAAQASGTTATFDVGLTSPGDEIVYKITVENQGTLDAIVNDIKASETGSDAIKFEVDGINKGDELAKQSTATFNVTIKYDENTTDQPNILDNTLTIEMNFIQKIDQNITSENIDIVPTRLAAKILYDNNEQSDAGIDFSKTSDETGTHGLYYTNTNTEDSKTTYYFRGNVDNNYVKFGKDYACMYNGQKVVYCDEDWNCSDKTTQEECLSTNVCLNMESDPIVGFSEQYCTDGGGDWVGNATIEWYDMNWRIVRINEDGSTRLIYEKLDFDYYPMFSWDDYGYGNDNAYVGYMYGDIGSTNYSDTHTNKYNSAAKEKIDDWYEEYLKDNYASYLADTGFCNDRSVSLKENLWHTNDTALGYGQEITYYGAYNRLVNLSQPQFLCPNSNNDLFTTKTNTKGNKALNYPIGLITADELSYAGMAITNYKDANNYLGDTEYLTMTPEGFYAHGAKNSFWYTSPYGGTKISSTYTKLSSSVRPVINLRANIEIISGDGRVGSEYIIKTN